MLYSTLYSFSQAKKNDNQALTQRGIVFFSINNARYIDSLAKLDDLNVLYLPDIFLPVYKLDTNTSVLKNFNTRNLKPGVGLFSLKNRNELFKLSQTFKNDTLGSPCYEVGEYKLLPILITYKIRQYSPNILNCAKPIYLSSDNSIIMFRYNAPSIEIMKVQTLKWGRM